MVSTNSKTEKTRQNNSFKKADDNTSLKTEDLSWLIDALPVIVFRSSNKLSWGMDYISSNVEKLTGYSKLDFIDQKILWSDIVFPEDATIVDTAVKAAKKNKSPYHIEYRIKRVDGSTAFVQEQAHLVFDDNGKLDYIAGVFSDLTSEVKQKADSYRSVKDDEIIQLEIFRSFVQKISEGGEIEQIVGDFTGETKKTVELINHSIGNIMGVLGEIQTISKAGKEGQLSIRANDSKFPGGWGMLLRELNAALDSIISPLNVAAEYVERISRGDIPNLITDDYNGDFNEIKNNLNTCIAAVNLLIEDSLMLSEAGVAGRLDTRADPTRHEGDFRKIVQGVNGTLDAVIGPLNVAAEYVERIGRGDIPDPITDNYNGDFNEIKNNLNNCIDGLQGLVECNHVLHRLAMNDHTKDVEGDYVGIFATMGTSTNEVRERLMSVTTLMNEIAVGDTSQLMEFKKIGRRCEQDHLLPAMIQAMENIDLLIEDTGMLSKAAVEGKLDTRANVSKHQGEYRKIVQGVNNNLDAVIGPLNVAAEYIERISRGDIPELITDNYNGDFNEIKNNLNTCIAAVNLLIEDSLMLSEAGVAGRLDTRADATRHEGDFKKIVQGVNDTLDAVISPLNVAAEYVERIGRGDIPDPITDNYNGDFNEIKNNLNNCIDGLQGLVECNNVLHHMAMNDHSKGVDGKYVGIYESMAESTNEVRDRLLKVTKQLNEIAVGDTSQLVELKRVGKRCEQDHLLPAVIEVMENINLLIEDAGMLSRAAVEGKLDTRADISRHHGEYKKIVQGVNDTLDAVIGPLNVAAEYVERISRGDIPEPIKDRYNGDFNEIKNNLNTCIAAVNLLIEDSLMLSEAGVTGRLDTRADATRHEGNFRKIIGGVNDTLDAVIGPLNVAAEYVERIGRGDIPDPITDNYNGDFNEIKNNLNNCIEGLQGLVECNQVLHRLAMNDHTKRVEGNYVGIFDTMGKSTNEVRDRLLNVTKLMNEIAVGDTSQLTEFKKIGKRCEQDHLLPAMIQAMENIELIIEDTRMLSKAAIEGKLDIRAEVSKHKGEYREIIEGVNATLDAVIGPLNVAAEYVERISRGDIPEPIKDNYNGDFNEIKNNLNTCIAAVNLLIEDSLTLSEAGVTGRLDTRADATRHEGDFRKIVEGVNDTLDAVIGPLNIAAEYVERISRGDIPQKITDNYNGDFNEIKNNLNNCIEGLQGLVECNNVLHHMAMNDHSIGVEGRYVGIYESMAESTNEVRDRLLKVTKQLNEIAVGDTSQLEELKRVGKRCEQDHLLPSVIEVMENINLLIEDAGTLSRAAVEGRLDTRANVSKHHGEYRKIVQGVNDTLDAVIGPLNVAAEYVERISRGDIPEPIADNYNGDFNEIKNNLNTCIAAVNLLIEDSLILSEAGVAGRLDTRADATRHEGDFRKIIEGVNDTLDAVIGPLNVSAEYVERISRGDIPQKITDNYNGDFNEIKNNLNNCIEGLQGLVECNNVLHHMSMNDHSKGVEGKYVGIYESMAESTNEVRDRLLKVTKQLNEIAVGDTSQLAELKRVGKRCEQDHLLPAVIEVMENINLLLEDTGMLTREALAGKLDFRADESKHKGEYKRVVQGINDTLDAIVCPLNTAADLIERISRGDIPETITDECYGDFRAIKNNLNACIDAINNLIKDSLMLSAAGIEGRLDTRADVTRHPGDFRKIVEGVNNTLDAVIGPLNVAAEYVERIGRGEIPEPITENYNGDFNEIKNNLNNCIDGLQGLVECNSVLQRMAVNDQTKGVEGQYVGIYSSMAEATNLVRARVLNVTNVLENIAIGNTSRLEELKKIGRRSEQDRLMPAIIGAMENVHLLIEDTEMLARATVEGKLDIRADVSKHQGEYRKIVEGVNETLDAVIGPLNVAAEYVERISRGDIPELITDNYKGDFNEIKNNLNTCITAINNLVADSLMLSEAGIAGQLETRADASRHQGKFRKIVVGVNDTLDAVIGPVNEAIKVSNEFSKGNFRARVDENLHVEGDFINFKNVLNDIGVSVSDVIKSAKSVTLNVVDSSDEASKGADEVAKAAGNVAMSSQKTSELTRELLYKIEGINKEIIELTESNEKIASTSKGILAAADEVVRIGKDAQTLGRDTNLKMESVEKIARESVVGITSLTEQIKQIDGIVQLINDITSQINLLSLNAAIEAARAGEHGRGFAVVAGEVKNLATKARNATETIENVVMSVQRDSKKTAEAINTANNEIIDGVNSVNKTLDALNTIIKNATQVTNDIGDITKAIEGQVNISMNVVTASEEGNAMTREVQKEAEGLAAIAQEASASVQEIGAAIHEMTDLSNKMKSEMEVFQV